MSAVYDAGPRKSFIAALKDIPEVWEIPYDDKAEPVYPGLVHDYRMGEGIADPGPLPVRRIPLDAPLPRPTPDERQVHVAWADPALPGKLNVLNLDVRRIVAQVDAPARPVTAPPAAASRETPPPPELGAKHFDAWELAFKSYQAEPPGPHPAPAEARSPS